MREILVVRHGESEWNRAQRWQGWEDIALTEAGEAQARRRGAELAAAGHRFAAVHASDLVRAARTADLIAEVLGAGPATRHAELRERFGGEWQGRTRAEVDERWPQEFAAWNRGELPAPPGGETDTVVLRRLDAALARVDETSQPGPVLVVTHHGVLRLLMTRAGVPRSEVIPNLGGRWFTLDGDGLRAGAELTPPAAMRDLGLE